MLDSDGGGTLDSKVEGWRGLDKSGVAAIEVAGTEGSIRFWACRMPRRSSGWFTVMNRDPIEDEVDCEATGADRARRNPGRRRVRLTGGASFGEFGRLDMWLCSQFTISGVQISILDTLCIGNWSI